MRIRMNEALATPTTTFKSGMDYDFEDAEAARLIAAGQASAVNAQGVPTSTVSTATAGTTREPATPDIVPNAPLTLASETPHRAPRATRGKGRQTMDAKAATNPEKLVEQGIAPQSETVAKANEASNANTHATLYGNPLSYYADKSDAEILSLPEVPDETALKEIRAALLAAATPKPDAVTINGIPSTEQPSQHAPPPPVTPVV